MNHKILFRVDSGKTMGSGHAMRSMALATQLQRDGVEVVLIGSGLKKAQQSALSFSSLQVEESDFETVDDDLVAIEKCAPDLVIFDGYHFRAELFESVRNQGRLVGVIDDNGETQAGQADFLINQNLTANRNLYPSDWTKTRFFLGLDYVLLRDEFTERTWQAIEPPAKTVLVAIGGTDSLDIAPTIVSLLISINFQTCSPNTQIEPVRATELNVTSSQLELFDPLEYPVRIANASLAILGGGSGLYEAIFCGVPTIAVVVADNQINIAKSLVDLGLIAGYVDFRPRSTRKGVEELLEVLNASRLRTNGKEATQLPSAFGLGKELLSLEIRNILVNR